MQRLRGYDVRISRFPQACGLCAGDTFRVFEALNTCQRRLLFCKESGDEGWNGTWAEVAFNVSQSQPYLTLPREIARLEAVTACNKPIPIRNQFYEYLQFGNGRLPKLCSAKSKAGCNVEVLSRNNAVLFTDLSAPPQNIALYLTDPADASGNLNVLLQGLDGSGNVIYSTDGADNITGQYVTLASPFAMAPMQFSAITGVQKDITSGSIQIMQVDPTTGAQVLLLTMEPSEQTAWYRRFYLNGLPPSCCPSPTGAPGTVQITAIAKLELIPVRVDEDYCLIQNLEALCEEAEALRYSQQDTPSSKTMAAEHHQQAARYLMGELRHYQGDLNPAVSFKPFGSASLNRVAIGMM